MLSGIRVLDLTGEPGFLAGKILAEVGADRLPAGKTLVAHRIARQYCDLVSVDPVGNRA